MNRIGMTLSTGLFVLTLVGCAGPAGGTNSSSKNTVAASNVAAPDNRNQSAANGNAAPAPSSANTNGSATGGGAVDSSKLVGVYDLNQIQKSGVTTMMSDAKVQLVFTADGRYSRSITTKGKLVHNESGQFSVAGDQLTFSVVLTGKTINKTPKAKVYTAALSPDARELKLTSETGETAVFYRAAS